MNSENIELKPGTIADEVFVDLKFLCEDFQTFTRRSMARGKRRSKPTEAEKTADSEDDMQTLKRNGKASFSRDETFENSEDECKFHSGVALTDSFRATRSNHVGWVKVRSQR